MTSPRLDLGVLANLAVKLLVGSATTRYCTYKRAQREDHRRTRPAPAPSSAPGQPGHLANNSKHTTSTDTSRYGTAVATSWDRVHPRLTHRGCWIDHEGELPVIEGTLVRLQVEHLPGDRDPNPVWLWSSAPAASTADVDRWWQAFLRRFDLEHTFRLFKQTLGWTAPKIRTPEAADRWTWLILAAHTQLRLARPLAEDLRRPSERPARPGRLTPARVRRAFRTSARRPPSRPVHRNPADPVRDARPAPATAARTPLQRRQNRQARPHHHRPPAAGGLKIKPRACTDTRRSTSCTQFRALSDLDSLHSSPG